MTIPNTMTADQCETLNDVWQDILNVIAAACRRRNLTHALDDIISDTITRTCSAMASRSITDRDSILLRARGCALDSIRSHVRRAKNLQEYRSATITANTAGIRRNGQEVH